MRSPFVMKNLNGLLRDFKDIKLKKIAKIEERQKKNFILHSVPGELTLF